MGTLVCKIELDKHDGITVEVDNEDGKITQTIKMDGTAITITVKGDQETSTYTQKQDSIHIKVKEYLLDTETITMKSSKASQWASEDIIDVKSTKDMSFKSSAKLNVESTDDTSMKSSAKFNVEATMDLAMKGMTAAMSATGGEAKVDGLTLKLAGQTNSEMSGAMTKVSGQGKLDLLSDGMATLKSSLTTVSGSLVKVGA